MLVSRVDMNIPTTTTASGTIHAGLPTAPPIDGEGFTGGSGGRCGGEGGGPPRQTRHPDVPVSSRPQGHAAALGAGFPRCSRLGDCPRCGSHLSYF